MSLLEELKSLGVNVDEGLDRVLGDEALYERMTGMFVDLVNNNSISPEDFFEADLSTLFVRIHVLKDITSNLAMTPLSKRYARAMDFLRSGQAAEAKKEFEKLLPSQIKIMDCIKRHMVDLETTE